jgi:endonuclease/exonuclease/phosphatase family metal-dependent hydrolase
MHLRLIIGLGVLMAVGWSVSGQAEPLTLATYNVENYTLADRVVDGVYRKSYPKPEAEKAALRAVIKALDADVLALQEIGGETFLRELQRDLASEGMEYPHGEMLMAADGDRGVAVLARKPLVSVTRHTDMAFAYLGEKQSVRRGLLEVRLAHEGGEITVFVLHLKSRYTDRTEDPMSAQQRAGEAVALRDRVLAVHAEPATARFVIVGDFNDARVSRPVKALLTRGDTTIAQWVPTTDSRGEGWTHFFKKDDSYSRVDHVLVSPALWPHVRGGVGQIYDGAETAKASDHRPVVITLE